MTFCLGMKCSEGLLAIADTRITSGSEVSIARKISVYQSDGHAMFVLTSGLRSASDKVITYFTERLERDEYRFDKMFKAANALAEEIRTVREEDGKWLADSGLIFDLYCIFGGQLEKDSEPRLFLIYPEGNWVEVGTGTPYVIIGESRYGKPLLDRVWHYDAPLADALRDGLLAFDATRTSAAGVDYPADVVLYRRDSFSISERQFSWDELRPMSDRWMQSIRTAVGEAASLVAPLFASLEGSVPSRGSDRAADVLSLPAAEPTPQPPPRSASAGGS